MKYKTIKIKPDRDEFNVFIQDLDGDWVETVTTEPNAMGFYNYPVSKKDEVAFNELRKTMIMAHLEEIEQLHKSMRNLIELKFEVIP